MKAGLVNLTGDDRAIILGALLWIADKLKSGQHEQARALWAAKGKQAFEADPGDTQGTDRNGGGGGKTRVELRVQVTDGVS
ncbi:conjugal transfer protein TraD [Bradyrhizobium sp.]|uniref:conjugal transfer protein TraD n=1 Tax=Bradyrhizobium sp. TaxID=376 RepID=UPI0025B9B561|nr:conjugal transfer protein TraD [Bradyrhizobium sp.]